MKFGKRTSKIVIIIMAIITAVLMVFVVKIKVDYDFEKFFPENAEETNFYYQYRDTFGSDNDFIIIALESPDNTVFDTTYLNNVDSITAQLGRLPNIEDARALTSMTYYVRDQFMGNTYKIPYFKKQNLQEDSIRIFNSKNIVGSFIDEEATSLAIIIKHKDKLNEYAADSLLINIEAIIAENGEYTHHKVGRIIGHTFYINIVGRELYLFVGLSVILIVLFLIITFRSFYGVYIPLIVVGLSVIWVVGVMGIMGKNLNLVLNIVPTILMVVGISGVVHLLSKYLDEIRNGLSKMDAIKKTYKEVGYALVFTSLTTIVGFVTLSTSDIRPVIDFGLITATGVFFAFLFSIFMMRSIITLLPKLKVKEVKTSSKWSVYLGKYFVDITKNSWLVLIVCLAVFGVSIWGTLQIKTNNHIMEDLADDHPMVVDYNFIDENFAGGRPFEMAIEPIGDSTSIWDYEVLKQLDTLESYLKSDYGVAAIVSPITPVKTAYMADNAGNPDFYRIPDDKAEFDKLIKTLKRFKNQKQFGYFLSSDEKLARITGKMGDVGSYKTNQLNEDLYQFMEQNIDSTQLKIQLTGAPYLMEINNKLLSHNVIQGLLIAFGIISLIVGLLYRSISIVIISLLTNILPLLIIGALMGLMGLDMKLSTSLIFTIAFGIAVDDTIHFLSKFKIELNKGYSKVVALKRTYISTGKAIIMTSLILTGGFLTLAISDFGGTSNIGILISITLFLALIADLTLLPVLLLRFYPEKKKK